MANIIIKMNIGKRVRYVEWSTSDNKPITPAMNLADLKKYIKSYYGKMGSQQLTARLYRCKLSGTSSMDGKDPEFYFKTNKAGPEGAKLTTEEIIEQCFKGKKNAD